MPTLVMLRHGQSQWNLENRFTGWVDIPLSEEGRAEARSAGERLRGMHLDVVFTSALVRAIDTAIIVLKEMGHSELPLISNQALNERHYGDLQGLNKAETAAKYGAEQVHIWRRSFGVRPPGKEGESLAMTIERVMPYYREHILPELRAGRNVLIVAHGNSLRSLLFHLDKYSEDTIMELNIPTGVPLVYEVEAHGDDVEVLSRRELTGEPV
ncbi:MAG: 2,3-diphosphoglycerate-dependent phosphoglycerate mutase [Bacteroidetes bacterium]|nr:2,3-diphosphoglycerate-dependent phosphoglycerate mutase [Bacteroidota bacterium]